MFIKLVNTEEVQCQCIQSYRSCNAIGDKDYFLCSTVFYRVKKKRQKIKIAKNDVELAYFELCRE